MFNIGPAEFLVLAIVGLIVLGPERIPELTRDAARMLRTLRELAQGARTQLREEIGPEFADLDLRDLNPRTAIQRAVLGDDADFSALKPRSFLQDALYGSDETAQPAAEPAGQPVVPAIKSPPLRRGEQAPFDSDAT